MAVSREKLRKILCTKKVACKMLAKFSPVLVVLHHGVGGDLLGPGELGESGYKERIVENPVGDGINDLE